VSHATTLRRLVADLEHALAQARRALGEVEESELTRAWIRREAAADLEAFDRAAGGRR
jgi:hypothetical protein